MTQNLSILAECFYWNVENIIAPDNVLRYLRDVEEPGKIFWIFTTLLGSLVDLGFQSYEVLQDWSENKLVLQVLQDKANIRRISGFYLVALAKRILRQMAVWRSSASYKSWKSKEIQKKLASNGDDAMMVVLFSLCSFAGF